jgi:hypothetical protein
MTYERRSPARHGMHGGGAHDVGLHEKPERNSSSSWPKVEAPESLAANSAWDASTTATDERLRLKTHASWKFDAADTANQDKDVNSTQFSLFYFILQRTTPKKQGNKTIRVSAPTSYKEIRKGLQISPSTAHAALRHLRDLDYLDWKEGRYRDANVFTFNEEGIARRRNIILDKQAAEPPEDIAVTLQKPANRGNRKPPPGRRPRTQKAANSSPQDPANQDPPSQDSLSVKDLDSGDRSKGDRGRGDEPACPACGLIGEVCDDCRPTAIYSPANESAPVAQPIRSAAPIKSRSAPTCPDCLCRPSAPNGDLCEFCADDPTTETRAHEARKICPDCSCRHLDRGLRRKSCTIAFIMADPDRKQ